MIAFHLYRAKVTISGTQQSLFYPDPDPHTILRDSLLTNPYAEIRQGYVWHIGNVAELDENAYYFAIGRVTKRTVELWMEAEQSFTAIEFEGAPYTHGLIDTALEVCALARKPALSPHVDGIASKLQKLLNGVTEDTRKGHLFEIAPIFDPKTFLDELRSAYAIKSFSATFGLPNPWDIDKDFQKPLEEFTKKARGKKTKATVSGDVLDAGILEEVTRSAAASGNEAEARIQSSQDGPVVKKKLRGTPLRFTHDAVDTQKERREAISQVRDYYQYVRETRSDDE